jgi:2-oxoglutarate ferredoxin oxidoreductase subunit alpha
MEMSSKKGMHLGLIRPITLYPFPSETFRQASEKVKHFQVMELNTGQMLEDVKLAVANGTRVDFYGRPPGSIPTPNELFDEIKKVYPR